MTFWPIAVVSLPLAIHHCSSDIKITSVGYVDLYSFILIIVFERKNVTTHLSGASRSGAHEDHLGVAMSAKSGPYILRELPIKAPIRT